MKMINSKTFKNCSACKCQCILDEVVKNGFEEKSLIHNNNNNLSDMLLVLGIWKLQIMAYVLLPNRNNF